MSLTGRGPSEMLENSSSPVLEQQLEEGLGSVLVQGLGEAVECWWHLKAQVQHTALTLDAHILGPLHEAVQVVLWCGGCANT